MKPQELLTHFTNQQNQLKSDIREMLMDSNIAIHAKIIDEVENIETKIDTIISHQITQNGRLLDHDKKITQILVDHASLSTYQKNCQAAKVVKNWKTVVTILVAAMIAVNYLTESITWSEILDVIKKIL